MQHLRKLLIILATLFLVTCSEEGSDGNLLTDFDRTEQVIEVVTYFYDKQSEVDAVFAEKYGTANDGREGFAVWANPSRTPLWCEIHTLRPKNNNDDNMSTLGHEMFHCLRGTFHKE